MGLSNGAEDSERVNSQPGQVALVGHLDSGQAHPQTRRVSRGGRTPAHDAAYRRLAAAILGLDVACLASELSSARAERAAEATSPAA